MSLSHTKAPAQKTVWFKAADMLAAQAWAEVVDDAGQAAEAARDGLVWDWFRVPETPAEIAYPKPAQPPFASSSEHANAPAPSSQASSPRSLASASEPTSQLPRILVPQLHLVQAYAARVRAA